MGSLEGMSFIKSLYDFKFESFVAMKVLRLVYKLIVILYSLGAVAYLLIALATGHRLVLNLERTYEYPSGIPDTPLGRGFYDLSWFHLGKLVIVITTFADARHCSSCSTITAPSSYVLD